MNFDWDKFKEYVDTYSDGNLYTSIIIKDMIYGLGISMSNEFEYAQGYDKFIEEILIPLISRKNIRKNIKL